jgi:hypothetical protein
MAVPRLPWAEALGALRWKQGEHVTMVGPSGGGKTSLALRLLPRRRYVAALGTKPRDATLDRLVKREGWHLSRTWPVNHEVHPRVVFWPRIERMADAEGQRLAVAAFLEDVYRNGGWTVYLDELRYVTGRLGLAREVELLWLQGRSLGVSLVGGTQRPAWVPLEAYDQATHLFLWRETDETNLRRLGGLAGVDTRTVRATIVELEHHEVLYVNTRTGLLFRTLRTTPSSTPPKRR